MLQETSIGVKCGIFYETFNVNFAAPRPRKRKPGTSDVTPGHLQGAKAYVCLRNANPNYCEPWREATLISTDHVRPGRFMNATENSIFSQILNVADDPNHTLVSCCCSSDSLFGVRFCWVQVDVAWFKFVSFFIWVIMSNSILPIAVSIHQSHENN